MKPTAQVSSKARPWRSDDHVPRAAQNFPATDYNYQSATDVVAGSPATRGSSFIKLNTFRNLSSDFLSVETHRQNAVEFALFVLVTAVSAWPMATMIVAMSRMVRGW